MTKITSAPSIPPDFGIYDKTTGLNADGDCAIVFLPLASFEFPAFSDILSRSNPASHCKLGIPFLFCYHPPDGLTSPRMNSEEKKNRLIEELTEYFRNEKFQTLAVRNAPKYPQPEPIHNDGFGDQEDKSPDIIAYDDAQKSFLIGIARTGDGDFESENSLTEYNVFLDQVDGHYGKPYRLFIIAPSSTVPQLTSLITHYIHREYWHKITFVSSHLFED